MTEQNQNLADIARKKRYLHLIEKLHSGTPLTKPEIKELEDFEKEPTDTACVQTMEEVAKVMGVTYRTVQRWKKDGMPVAEDRSYDLEEIKKWYEQKTGNVSEINAEKRAYWDQKIREYKATLLELELKKVTGELLDRAEVEKGRIERVLVVKQSFLALPTTLASVLAMKEPREIETILYDAIAEIIDEFAGERKHNVKKKKTQENLDQTGKINVEAPAKDKCQPVG